MEKEKDLDKKEELQDKNQEGEPENSGNEKNQSEEVKEDSPKAEDADESSEEGQEEELSEVEKLRKEKDELHDKYLRLYSEFENFRRRTNKEKLTLIDTANERLVLEILPVMDDFERAMESMQNSSEVASVCEGVTLIFNKFKKTLTDAGVKEIECIGEAFDPEIHDAVTKIPAPKKKLKGKVVDQIQKGYKLKEKVIRHSKVVVGE